MTPKNHIEDEPPEDTGSKQALTQFRPGVSGNPKGRPRGARSKLGEQFLNDLHDEWEKNGAKALALCAAREPTQFVKIVGNLLPREIVTAALNVNAEVNFSNVEDAKNFLRAYRMVRDAPMIEAKPIDDEGAVVTQAWRADGD